MHHDYRNNYYQVSLSDTEYETVENRRTTTGLTKSQYGRQSLMFGEIKGHFSSESFDELNAALNKVGNNINQIARALNAGNKEYAKKENILEQLDNLSEIIAEIYNSLVA